LRRTDWANWLNWRSSYTMLPYVCEIEWEEGLPASWEPFWECAAPYSCLLESGRTGDYTYLGLHPFSIITGRGEEAVERVRLESPASGSGRAEFDIASLGASQYEIARKLTGKPMDILRRWMADYRSPLESESTFFSGGCIGYIGYDVVRSLERLPELAAADLDIPDYAFMMFDQIWVYNHRRRKLSACVHTSISREIANDEAALLDIYRQAEGKARQMLSWWAACAERGMDAGRTRAEAYRRWSGWDGLRIDLERVQDLQVSMTREQFTAAVERIQEYIRAGDVFQVNLSVRQAREVKPSCEVLYEWLRLLNPSPYMGLLRCGDYQLVSASPELLIRKEGRKLRTRPIAGTRRRGHTPEEDRKFEEELRTSAKERAEHVMLVDLERNDIGRTAEYGTVRVDQLMVIERYSHVMHLVSEVTGMLRQGLDAFDALAAVFPGGTITGAPKIRTMEIIEELEPVRRGIYTGSFGWIDYNGNMELNIIIRTLLKTGGTAYVQAGAGIVIDSIPEREYKESLNKAKALWKAVQYAEQEMLGEAAVPHTEGECQS